MGHAGIPVPLSDSPLSWPSWEETPVRRLLPTRSGAGTRTHEGGRAHSAKANSMLRRRTISWKASCRRAAWSFSSNRPGKTSSG